MPQVELIYDSDCPNLEDARRQLRRALIQANEPQEWSEWERSDPESPVYARQYGSPTILIKGRDVAGDSAADGANCCRLYWDRSGQVHGVPSVDSIVSVLDRSVAPDVRMNKTFDGFRALLTVLPAVGVSLLPKLACPACWPAYAGLLSAVGLGFLMETKYLLPLTVLFLVVAVGALRWRAQNRKGHGPFVVGLLAAAIVVVGKFNFESNPAMYGGIALLVGASLWNSWPKRFTSASCPGCEPAGQFHRFDTKLSQKEV